MNFLPENVIRETLNHLSASDCAHLSACSRRLNAIVRLPYDRSISLLAIYSTKGWNQKPLLHWTLTDKKTYVRHLESYHATFAMLHDGLRSRLMKPLLECTRLSVDYCRFDDRGLSNELLEAFHGAPVIAELYCVYCQFQSFEHFCRLIDTVRASLYIFRITPKSPVIDLVTKYSETHPDMHYRLSIAASGCQAL